MKSVPRLMHLIWRTNRGFILGWASGVIVLLAVTVPSYAASYPTLSSRGHLVAGLRSNLATKALYGVLPLPGTLGQLAQWETGSYLMVLLAALGILLAGRVGRRAEESGITEVVEAQGIPPFARPAAGYLFVVSVFAAIGIALAVVLVIDSRISSEVPIAGGLQFAGALTLVGMGFGVTSMALGEVFPTGASASAACWLFFGVEFGLRIIADLAPAHGLRWFTWFGLRDLDAPFTRDHSLPLVVGVAGVGILLILGSYLHVRREYGTGLVHASDRSVRRLHVNGPIGLAAALGRASLTAWLGVGVAVSAFFGGLSHGLIHLVQSDRGTARLLSNLAGSGSPNHQFFALSSTFIGLIAVLYGVRTVLVASRDEHAGLLDQALATGVARSWALGAQVLVAALGALGVLVVSAAVEAVAAGLGSSRSTATGAWVSALDLGPRLLLAVGVSALIIGARHGFGWLAWTLVAWSGFATLFGGLVRLPSTVMHVSYLWATWLTQEGGDVSVSPAAPLTMSAVAVMLVGVAGVVISKRDIITAH